MKVTGIKESKELKKGFRLLFWGALFLHRIFDAEMFYDSSPYTFSAQGAFLFHRRFVDHEHGRRGFT